MEPRNAQPVFPWYKERLHTKYLKDPTKKIPLASSCWHFVNMSIEDFSDCSSWVQRGPSPVIFHGDPKEKTSKKTRRCISKEQACFSKCMIQKQIRREYVTAVEEKLKQHPLAVHPHYKDHITPELFNKVVSILDPDICVNSVSALPSGDNAKKKEEEIFLKSSKEEVDNAKQGTYSNKISPDAQDPNPRNHYILQMNGNGTRKRQMVNVNQQRSNEDMTLANKLFTKWFASPNEEISVAELATQRHFQSGF
ncbi:hypothetical protein Q5P01_015147 [Channa striata]|uniref:Uncharacterized protein n=1 Tax=Channa striata TaxID=64152 RepID=A0AA88SG19_CHASR|nr:hypothetical protein Q5P01_015147 [Channa striata]